MNPIWIATGEGPKWKPEKDLFDGLRKLEEDVTNQTERIDQVVEALQTDPRWKQVEDRLNFLSEQMRKYAVQALDEDEADGSPQWSPIGLKPGEPIP